MDQKPPLTPEAIDQLVLESQNGNSKSFAALYDRFVDQIYRYTYYRAGSKDAEDLTELVFLKAWESIRQYHVGSSRFSAWVFRIAHNVVIDYYRAHQTIDELSPEVKDERPHVDVMERAHRTLTSELLSDAMKELKDHYRQIIILKYINEFSNEEIAQIIDKSQAALRILQFRALRMLKRILEARGIEGTDL